MAIAIYTGTAGAAHAFAEKDFPGGLPVAPDFTRPVQPKHDAPADVERIEPVRGPNAAVWGANTLQGAINIVTRSPAADRAGRAWPSLGDDGRRQADPGEDFAGGARHVINGVDRKVTRSIRPLGGPMRVELLLQQNLFDRSYYDFHRPQTYRTGNLFARRIHGQLAVSR